MGRLLKIRCTSTMITDGVSVLYDKARLKVLLAKDKQCGRLQLLSEQDFVARILPHIQKTRSFHVGFREKEYLKRHHARWYILDVTWTVKKHLYFLVGKT